MSSIPLNFSQPVLINDANATLSIQIGGTNRYVGVLIGGAGATFVGPTNSTTFIVDVSIGASSFTRIGEKTRYNTPNVAAYAFGLLNPTAGLATINITKAPANFFGYAIAFAAQNVHQTT